MYFYLIFAVQAFCIYHVLKHKNEYYWIFIILFIPAIGSLIYLFTHVFNENDVKNVSNDITSIINPTKKVKNLEKRLAFSETFQNKINLADAYFEIKDYPNAIKYYEDAISEEDHNETFVIKQLVISNYNLQEYKQAVFYGEKIKGNSDFIGSKAQFFFGLSLKELGDLDYAEKQLMQIDKRYSNYEERLLLAKFYNENNKTEKAKEILEEIFLESQHMTPQNKRKYKLTIKEVQDLLKSI